MKVVYHKGDEDNNGCISVSSSYAFGSSELVEATDIEDYWITLFHNETHEPTYDANIYIDDEDNVVKAALYLYPDHDEPLETCLVEIREVND